ncbi:S-adenosyl-L-methionine-dependent methyltransferase [Infundibulicybe gibba]|nr:S-adenosyl-L-methionine-dependent methyltransferase [Infundibulicybe gibba]
MSTYTSNLRRLADIINKNVDIIESMSKEDGVVHPSIDDIYDVESPAEKFTTKPEVLDAALLATSAASQLLSTLRLPGLSLYVRASAYHIPAALRIASEACVVEQLREAGSPGLHVRELGAKTGTDPTLLGRALRLLATHYIFKEISPNVFVNNRISSIIDTGFDSSLLTALARNQKENPTKEHGVSNVQGKKYPSTAFMAALVDMCTDEAFKASSFLPDVALANDISKTSFQRALRWDDSLWDFYEKHPGYMQRFQSSMIAWTKFQPQQLTFKGFDWSGLPESALVVDVGGGNGSQIFEIIKKAPHLKFIVQDREQNPGTKSPNLEQQTWEGDPEKKKRLETGQVKFEVQDFLEAQPSHVGEAAVFFLRFITHDWATPHNVKILKRLHEVASPVAKLILNDQIAHHACPPPREFMHIEGATPPTPPAPLLANLGEANSGVYFLDFSMASLFNSQERTLGEFQEMVREAGWKIERVFQTSGNPLSHIVCVKI